MRTATLTLACLLLVIPCQADTITVDANGYADYNNIQAAINAAAEGDVLIVADGTYTGSGNRDIDFLGKAIIVRSENGPENCIINCQGTQAEPHRGFFFSSGEGKDSIVDGFTITNARRDHAGGMYIRDNCSPTVMSCKFINNRATYGAAIGIRRYSNSLIYNCTFEDNSAYDAGAINNYERSNPTIINCTFVGNSAGRRGGAMKNYANDVTLINCMFSGNSGGTGGAIWMRGTLANVINTTFSGNFAGVADGLYVDIGRTNFTNCILWNNGEGQSSQIYPVGWLPSVNFCCIDGLDGTLGGVGNIGEKPMFVDADGLDDIIGTIDDNLELLFESPCVDIGNTDAVPADIFDLDGDGNITEKIPIDLKGGSRFVNDLVDMGAYERHSPVFLVNPRSLTIAEGGTSMFTVALASDPLGTVEALVEHYGGDNDIVVQSGSILSFNPSNYQSPQTVILGAKEDPDHLNGRATIRVTAPWFLSFDVSATEADNEPNPDILFVDSRAQGLNNGSSWTDAYTSLRKAFLIAAQYTQIKEVRVAQGIYTPGEPGDRQATFQLVSDTHIKGGYVGVGHINPNARNIELFETILSGDLEGDDIGDLDDPSRNDNSYHVVTGSNTDITAVLDGFTIIGGNANSGSEPYSNGGGIYTRNGSPMVINCNFVGNQAKGRWYSGGGAMFNIYSPLTVANCLFVGNEANFGGAVQNLSVSPTFHNCTFFDNHASAYGGGIDGGNSSPIIAGCEFYANSANVQGGAVDNQQGRPKLINSTIVGNHSPLGGGYNDDSGGGIFTNSIFWNNNDSSDESAQMSSRYNALQINYCCIHGWTNTLGGIGNFGDNPLFVDPNNYDYRLQPGSPCINAGDPNYEAEPNETDLDGNPRVVDGRIDMGAYEANYIEVAMKFTPQALNLGSKGKWVKAHFVLPEEFSVEDVNTNTPAVIALLGIKSDQINVFINEDGLVEIEAAFSRSDFCALATSDDGTEVIVIGLLNSGRNFYGRDTIRIITKSLEYIAVLASHWLEGGCGAPDWCGGGDLDHNSMVDLVDFALFDGCCIEVIRQ